MFFFCKNAPWINDIKRKNREVKVRELHIKLIKL